MGLLSAGLDLLYPPRCPLCGQPDVQLCRGCAVEMTLGPGQPIQRELAGLVWALACGVHEGLLRESILALKYGGARVLAEPLGERLRQIPNLRCEEIDAVIPVPLHDTRFEERGFNQAELLTAALCERANLPMRAGWLRRQRATRAQVGLSEEQRARNVEAAFEATGDVAEKRLLLVDDVCTSGATLVACARALREAGAAAVFALTVSAPAQGDKRLGAHSVPVADSY